MSTAEQLLTDKKLCEQVPVHFPTGTLFEPYDSKTQGIVYKAAPVGTLTLAIAQETGGFEYFFAQLLGDVFTPDESS